MIGVFSFLSLRYAQFAYKYTNILDEQGIDYEFVFWNRDGLQNPGKSNWISYDYTMDSFQPFLKKIWGFISFSKYMRKIIKEKKYDKLIVLTTQTAIPLFDILLKSYKSKYIYDYRDVTYENIGIYRKLVNKLVCNSCFTAISSMGFKRNLKDSHKFVISHNTRVFELNHIEKTKSSKIRVVYWGMIRQLEFNCKICDLFSKDNRFQLVYHGAGYHKELFDYCKSMGYENISITGAYALEDIDEFATNTDIILNCYENDKKQRLAMTVKFYDSIRYQRPMLVTEGSYMGRIVKDKGLGWVIDFNNKNCLDALIEKYTYLELENLEDNMELTMDEIKKDDQVFKKQLLLFLSV